ncbi:MAG TPA: papain-like cysteine protease family protein [Kofleriaceae bacterium]|nr:papain-like cysteine protease family protein [Kofleriaceae bacterium]
MRRALLAAMVVTLVACVPTYKGASRRVSPAQLRADDAWVLAPAPAMKQHADVDCGAAALAMVVARWRPELDRERITRSVRVVNDGFRLGDLRDLARSSGLRAFALVGDQALLRHEVERGRPVVIGLHRPYRDRARAHYEVVIGVHPDGRVATIDPIDAQWHVRPLDGLMAEWDSAGRPALVVLGVR